MKVRHLARMLKLKHKFRDRFAEQVEADYERMQAPEYARLRPRSRARAADRAEVQAVPREFDK